MQSGCPAPALNGKRFFVSPRRRRTGSKGGEGGQ